MSKIEFVQSIYFKDDVYTYEQYQASHPHVVMIPTEAGIEVEHPWFEEIAEHVEAVGAWHADCATIGTNEEIVLTQGTRSSHSPRWYIEFRCRDVKMATLIRLICS